MKNIIIGCGFVRIFLVQHIHNLYKVIINGGVLKIE